jgi:hypothetical protein
MSTFYYFECEKCKTRGGWFTRQAWGWGNFDIIESFKFICFHLEKCGADIRTVSEFDENSGIDLAEDDGARAQFLTNARGIFPRSDDWAFVARSMSKKGVDPDAGWTAKLLGNLKPPKKPKKSSIYVRIGRGKTTVSKGKRSK